MRVQYPKRKRGLGKWGVREEKRKMFLHGLLVTFLQPGQKMLLRRAVPGKLGSFGSSHLHSKGRKVGL